jgi:hypothetical protein
VLDCQCLRGKEDSINNNERIILSLSNNITKSALISKVIKTDKSKGVNLSVNEYLSSYNAHILYKLRFLRKEHRNSIFACFSRNGLVYYKARKDSRPKLVNREEEIEDLANELRNHTGMLMQGNTRGQTSRESIKPSNNNYRMMQIGNTPPSRFKL